MAVGQRKQAHLKDYNDFKSIESTHILLLILIDTTTYTI